MKKIIIVNNNMKVGGVQKSLYNLLWSIDTKSKYKVTLLLFSKTGEYTDKLPPDVEIIECKGAFRYLGKSQGEFKNSLKDTLIRGLLVVISRIFGNKVAFDLLVKAEPKLKENFDCAISFFHNGRRKAFYGGVQDYVLGCINADKKIAFLHGDYISCGAHHSENDAMMKKFDVIASCSDGCRRVFEKALPELKDRSVTVRNCHRFDEITALSDNEPVEYNQSEVNVITVSRLAHEKGIDRAINAVAEANKAGIAVKLHIVGGGPMYSSLVDLVKELGIEDKVVFYKEQSNPFRYMKNADLFVLSSYHEAAPMVIDEARCLGLPMLTTATTSSQEMVTDEGCGWVCENDREAFEKMFLKLVSNKNELVQLKKKLIGKGADNKEALFQFDSLFNTDKK